MEQIKLLVECVCFCHYTFKTFLLFGKYRFNIIVIIFAKIRRNQCTILSDNNKKKKNPLK